MIWGESNIHYRVPGPAGSKVDEIRTYVDRKRGLTQWWTRFFRVEHPRETFPLLSAGARNFQLGRAGWLGVGVSIIARSLTWVSDREHHVVRAGGDPSG